MSIVTTTLPLSGERELAERYDVAVDRLLRFHPDVINHMIFLAQQPDFPMGQVLNAYLSLSSTDQPDVARARSAAATLAASRLNEREQAHFAAVQAWVDGDWHGAARHLDDLLQQWPTDLLALQIGHQLDFFLGDAANLRDRVARVRLAFDPADPQYGFVLGMQAFGLEESGSYEAAEATGLAALDCHPDDVWAVHAVAHAHEMRGAGSTTASGTSAPARPTGATTTCSPSTTGGTWPCSCSRRAGPTTPSRSTTSASTTPAPTMCPSRCSTPAPCCGGSPSTAPTRAHGSRYWPTRGEAGPAARAGTCSTTSTP